MENITKLWEILNKSKRIVAFTGAGISCPAPTNIPDFRGDKGLYTEGSKDKIPPEEIISHSFFLSHPDDFFKFYGSKMVYRNALCNKAHLFFAELEKKGYDVTVVTQNIDGLHQKAGSKKVYELHGSVWRNYCMSCHKFYSLNDLDVTKTPKCSCGGIIKPDVVLYEEGLDHDIVTNAVNAISRADTLIVVGTSLTVYPAASFIGYFRGTNIILINKQKTTYDHIANLVFNCDIIEVVDALEEEDKLHANI